MQKIIVAIHTPDLKLDEEVFPDWMPAVPAVGDLITSARVWGDDFSLQLKVIEVNWEQRLTLLGPVWTPNIKLGPRFDGWTLEEFHAWYHLKTKGASPNEEFNWE